MGQGGCYLALWGRALASPPTLTSSQTVESQDEVASGFVKIKQCRVNIDIFSLISHPIDLLRSYLVLVCIREKYSVNFLILVSLRELQL